MLDIFFGVGVRVVENKDENSFVYLEFCILGDVGDGEVESES